MVWLDTSGISRNDTHRAAFGFRTIFDDDGHDIAEYAVMVAAILIIVIGTTRLVGSNSNTVFSNVASTIQ